MLKLRLCNFKKTLFKAGKSFNDRNPEPKNSLRKINSRKNSAFAFRSKRSLKKEFRFQKLLHSAIVTVAIKTNDSKIRTRAKSLLRLIALKNWQKDKVVRTENSATKKRWSQ